jgi:acyl-CoA synthetase (AMP-forming)/AMP-acid ligase II
VALRPGHAARPDDLITHRRTRLAAFKCPRRVVVLDQLPRSASGKIQKTGLVLPASRKEPA